MRTLYLQNNEITNVEALAGLVNLQTLGLRGNDISDPLPLLPLTANIDIVVDPIITFVDASLASAVRSALGLDADANITLNQLRTLTSLVAASRQISDLTGLAYATQLTTLNLSVNTISDLSPLSGLTALTTLTLTNNEISDLSPLLGLTSLTRLALSDNSISDISSLSGLINLTGVSLSENNIVDISSLSSLTQLQFLIISDNEITTISSLSGLTSLTWAYLSGNEIIDLSSLSGLRSLSILELSDNSIIDLSPLSGLRRVLTLDLSDNEIIDLSPLSGLTALSQLYLDENSITNVEALAGLVNLRRLRLAGNDIANTRPLAFLTATIDITVDRTVVFPDAGLGAAVRSALGLAPDADIEVQQLRSLTSLNALASEISDLSLLEYATALTTLDLSVNEISDISPLSELTELTTLSLSGNALVDVSVLASLTSLTTLDLSTNEIVDISYLSDLTALTTLDLTDNDVSDISSFSTLTALERLYLSENEITDIGALSDLTTLTTLYLDDNSITNVEPLPGLVNLTVLKLSGNEILDTSPLYPLTQQTSPVDIDIAVLEFAPWDVNEDGSVDIVDSELVTVALGQSGAAIVNPRTDVNGDDIVDNNDLLLVTSHLDAGSNAAPAALRDIIDRFDPSTLESLDRDVLQAQLHLLRVKSDGSAQYQYAIALLEAFLAATRPEETVLLANYPNPFNPETWLPYHLANASDVRITIYDMRGVVVRRLDLGHQREGYYTNRSRAAYWDGRNAVGERVASGIYFYQLEADDVSRLRKMVILK